MASALDALEPSPAIRRIMDVGLLLLGDLRYRWLKLAPAVAHH